MFRQIFTTRRVNQPAASSGAGAVNVDSPQDENAFKAEIDDLYSMSRRGMWAIFIFLATSAVAHYFRKYNLDSTLSGDVVAQLGPTPDVILVNIVLGVSTVSSLIIIAGRIYNEGSPSNTWTHLGFRLFFYLLYFISSSLNEYYNVVLISGLVVLALQHCNVWNYYTRAIDSKMDKFETLNTCGKGVTEK